MIKTLLKYALYGLAVGSLYLVLGLIVLDLFWHNGFNALMQNFTVNVSGGLAISAAVSVGAIAYEFDRINLGLQITIHATFVLIVALPIAFGLGWFPIDSPTTIGIGVAVWALMSVATWLGFYLFGNHEVKKINKKIKSREGQK